MAGIVLPKALQDELDKEMKAKGETEKEVQQ
jgi:hypothetical protein